MSQIVQQNDPHRSATLLVSCADRPGLVAAITDFIARHNGNILHLDQHVDSEANIFFMRVVWSLEQFDLPGDAIAATFQPIADEFSMTFELHYSDVILRMAIFVSKASHVLYEVLSRYQSGEYAVEIPLIISNHPTLEKVAHQFDINFYVIPVTKESKREAEQKQIDLLRAHDIDLIVLARYMQILSPEFVSQFPQQIINIHHSFLPAFPGAQPYHQAYNRGVKIIGATSHYVTAELDAGPIIEQDIVRVNHKDSITDLIRKGRDVEKLVLSRAIRYHLNHQILTYNNKTVVFG